MNMKIFFCATLIALPFCFVSASNSFSRTLKFGMEGGDVRDLQILLNTDSETRVAESGAGSPGNETDYFGPATKRAVIKFQEKYKNEILSPVGLTQGTGFFGEKTREKAIALSLVQPRPPISVNSTQSIVSPTDVPSISFLSSYSGGAGQNFEISGENFSYKNNVYFDDFKIKDIVSKSGANLKLAVPDLSPGVYFVYVENEHGKNKEDRIFAITKKGATAPKVESIAPDQVARGSKFTVHGVGFAKKNIVRSGAGDLVADLQADGTLLVSVPQNILPFVPVSSTAKISLPLWFYVVNENGVSGEVKFTLEL